MQPLHVCILATGQGSRLGSALPSKALIPILGTPLVRHQLTTFARWGVAGATLLARDDQDLDLLRAAVDGAALRCSVVPIAAAAPGGANRWPGVFDWLVERARHGGPVLTVNADLLLDAGWAAFVGAHRRSGADLSVSAVPRAGGDGQYGKPRALPLGDDGFIVPDGRAVEAHQVGMSLTEADALLRLADVSQTLEDPWVDGFVPLLLSERARVRIGIHTAYWRDLGTWRRIWAAHADALAPTGRQHVDPTALVHRKARLSGWAWVGPGAQIGPGAVVTDSVVAADAIVGARSHVTRSFVGTRAALPAGAALCEQVLHAGAEPQAMPETLGT